MWPLRSAFVSGRFFSGYKERQRWIYEEFGLKVLSKSVYNLVRSHPGALLKVSRPVPLEEAWPSGGVCCVSWASSSKCGGLC